VKKIMNDVSNIVDEMCVGFVQAHSDIVSYSPRYRLIKRAETADKVQLISGGGSGHEPAHAGFVGRGMLDVAVCGDVFASPSSVQVYNAISETASDQGTLLIIKNYSGDVMNFEEAAEMAEDDDIEVQCVYVNDDVAVQDSLYTVGRRGVAGTVFVHKIAGAAAERGDSLSEVKAVAEKAIANVRSLGFALTSCTVPANGKPTFELPEDTIEYGVGIHGEPGIERQALRSADELAADMLERILSDYAEPFAETDEIAVLINGFGGTPLMELYLFNHSVQTELEKRGINVYKTFVGNYMTSLEMAGASITVFKLDDELKELLDAPAETAAIRI
jgi:dihydroxyacetone kinase DhaK subunit